jgi:SpoVK/Ycf46/Vps4 family AAA+-type ATPase
MSDEINPNPLMITNDPPDLNPPDSNNPENDQPNNNDKKSALLDITFYLRRINRIMENISEFEKEIKDKQKEAETIMGLIDESMKLLTPTGATCIIEEDINTLDDLIFVAKKYGTLTPINRFSVDVKILYRLIEPLERLKDVIGMEDIKTQIVDQIVASLLNFYDNDILFHTIIKGPPGVGKTLLSKILGEIYVNIGVLKNNGGKLLFKVVTRSDLIGKYLGHTAAKTQEVIDSCDGGVMFIDEVYSLGNNETKDSFAKECIDTLNMNLTEKKNFICIIAGYPKEIEECFFAYNPGLKRRFPFTYEINSYSSNELAKIFISKIKKSNWDITFELAELESFIKVNINDFNNFGGDIDNLILNCKITHGRRVFGKSDDIVKKLTIDDVKDGYHRFIKLKNKGITEDTSKINHMYL